jgi:hypothetical protein
VERFETESLALLPGQQVRVRILSRQPWGVIAEIVGHEQVAASIDIIQQFGQTVDSDAALNAMYPETGSEIDAVVEQIRRYSPPASVRLSIRPADLETFRWTCDFCGNRAILSAGGDGLVLDVRSNDGPGSTTVIAHRACLADRVRPENADERARALNVGKPNRRHR